MARQGITILGTAGDSTVMGKQLRASGGIVITTPESQCLVDPGPGSLVQHAKCEFHPRETTCIVLTHQHVGHAGDAAAVITAMTHNGIDRRGVLVTNPGPCIIPQAQRDWLEKTVILEPGNKVGINDVEIQAVAAQHYDSQANSYLFRTPEYVVGYTGDAAYSEEWAKGFIGANIMVINCHYPDAISGGDHLNTEAVIELLKVVKPELAVLTHFGMKMVSSDPLAQARKVNRETKVQVVAAKDGLVISPSAYNAKQKQKTLSGFSK